MRRILPSIFLVVFLWFLWLEGDARGEIPSAASGGKYMAFLEETEIQGQTGETLFVTVHLVPDLPPGYFVSLLLDMINGPEGADPEVVTGYPRSKIRFDVPGEYGFRVRASLVSKSSCGGVETEPLLEQTVSFTISEAGGTEFERAFEPGSGREPEAAIPNQVQPKN